jgi:hypothetical protein
MAKFTGSRGRHFRSGNGDKDESHDFRIRRARLPEIEQLVMRDAAQGPICGVVEDSVAIRNLDQNGIMPG